MGDPGRQARTRDRGSHRTFRDEVFGVDYRDLETAGPNELQTHGASYNPQRTRSRLNRTIRGVTTSEIFLLMFRHLEQCVAREVRE